MKKLLIPMVSTLLLALPGIAHGAGFCTMDAKLCPDGVTYVGRDSNRNCAWQLCPGETDACVPYQCNDGALIDRCSADGTVINYFAAPCLTHGGERGASPTFIDVPSNHVNAEAIAYVKAQGIVAGYGDGTYRPEQTINRAEFTKIIMGAATFDGKTCKQSAFIDVPMGIWFASPIYTARCNGVIDGYPDGTFRPAAPITVVEAAKIITTALRVPKTVTASTAPWYESYVRALASRNAIPLTITRFDQPITRGEMAEMIYRLKTGNTSKPSQSFASLSGGASTKATMRTYVEPRSGAYTVRYPDDWIVQVNDLQQYPDQDYGTSFALPVPASSKKKAFVSIAIMPLCRAIGDANVDINGKNFTRVFWEDDDTENQIHWTHVTYEHKVNPTTCYQISSDMFMPQGTHDAALESLLDTIIHSFTLR